MLLETAALSCATQIPPPPSIPLRALTPSSPRELGFALPTLRSFPSARRIMKCYALLAASLALAAAGPTGVKLVDDDGNVETITFVNGVLSVPQHCRSDTCSSLQYFSDNVQSRVTVLERTLSSTTDALKAVIVEDTALRSLVTALTSRLAALEGTHSADMAASDAADVAFAKADRALVSAVDTVTKLQGPQGVKGDPGSQGIQGEAGAKGEKGDTGANGKDGENGATAAAVVAAADATGPDCQQWTKIGTGKTSLSGITGRSPVNIYKAESPTGDMALFIKDTDPTFQTIWTSATQTVQCATNDSPAWKDTVNAVTGSRSGDGIGSHRSGDGSDGWLLWHGGATAGYDNENPCIIPGGRSLVAGPSSYRYGNGKLTEIFACERLPAAATTTTTTTTPAPTDCWADGIPLAWSGGGQGASSHPWAPSVIPYSPANVLIVQNKCYTDARCLGVWTEGTHVYTASSITNEYSG